MQSTPRCVGCDQWKGGKRWRGRAGCPIPQGWQRTLPLRDPPVDHSQSTLICILCYKQWGHLKEAIRETGQQVGSDGHPIPVSSLAKGAASKHSAKSRTSNASLSHHNNHHNANSSSNNGNSSHSSHASSYNHKKRSHSDMLSYDRDDDYSSDADSDETHSFVGNDANSNCESNSMAWHSHGVPQSPNSQDLDAMDFSTAHSRPGSPSSTISSSSTASTRSSTSSSSHCSGRSARKGTPCISILPAPFGTPALTLHSLIAARASYAPISPATTSPTNSTTGNHPADAPNHSHTQFSRCYSTYHQNGGAIKRPKLTEV